MIRRVNRGRGHSYVDDDTGVKVPGVTTILDAGIPKKALINWAATTTAEYAVDHWTDLADLAPSVRLKTLNKARWSAKDEAANRGTQVHRLAEQLVQGERVAVPDEIAGHVESYVRFLDDFDVQPVLVEKTVHSAKYGYCGTFDLIADLLDPDDPEPDPSVRRRLRYLLDLKTNQSGIFGETALQLAAYRHADVWIDEDEEAEHDMVDVDVVGAVHVRADGYDLIPLEAGQAQMRTFLYAMQIAEFTANGRDLVGEPVISPQTSTFRLIREDQ